MVFGAQCSRGAVTPITNDTPIMEGEASPYVTDGSPLRTSMPIWVIGRLALRSIVLTMTGRIALTTADGQAGYNSELIAGQRSHISEAVVLLYLIEPCLQRNETGFKGAIFSRQLFTTIY